MNNFPDSNSIIWQTVKLLCTTAIKGLSDCYCKKDPFEQDLYFDTQQSRLNMASNLRYITIAQIGIKHWLKFHANNDTPLPDLWKYLSSKSWENANAGDLGLAIWASVESNEDNCKSFVSKLVNNWTRLHQTCNAVELAWVVQGMVRFLQTQRTTDEAIDLLKDAHCRLMGLYKEDSGLFARHSRKRFKEAISRNIACFADQVYPILAMSCYAQYFNDSKSLDAAVAVADTICRLQGPQGQWWWHYDVNRATVAEEYPVFSVHQHAMAPMALLAVDEVAGTNHTANIEKGLGWLNKNNELNEPMILPENGIIWRDIHRREIKKTYRLVRGILTTAGLTTAHCLTGKNLFGFVVNRECRPYCLGWLLYAWANWLASPHGSQNDVANKQESITYS